MVSQDGITMDMVAPRTGEAPVGDDGATPSARALLEHVGFPAFAVEAKAAGHLLTVVVNDTHRYTDTRSFMDAVFSILDALPVVGSQPGVRILVAAGTHTSDELERAAHEERMAAPYLARIAEIEWHDADSSHLVQVGPYEVHRWMGEKGYYLACGSMEPHYFAGVTGAHKTLTVGVMSRASIERNHAHAMSADVAPLKLEGNPVHEGIVDAVRALESDGAHLLALNQVIVGGDVIGATAGHPLEALADGLSLVRSCFGYRVDRQVDLIVARVSGPLDRDLYQADKGIKNTEAVVRDGGVLILDAACRHGIGIRHFVELLEQAPTYEAACAIVARRGYRLGDHKAVRLRALTDTRGVHVGLVTRNIDPSMSAVLGMTIFQDRATAAAWAHDVLASTPSPRGLIVEDAGNLALEVAAG